MWLFGQELCMLVLIIENYCDLLHNIWLFITIQTYTYMDKYMLVMRLYCHYDIFLWIGIEQFTKNVVKLQRCTEPFILL